MTIDAKQNSDLFWAFRGGGGGKLLISIPSTPFITTLIDELLRIDQERMVLLLLSL